MDRYFYDLIEGAAKHPDYDITFWGPGFDGWSDLETPLQNFERVHTCMKKFRVQCVYCFHIYRRSFRLGGDTSRRV